MLVKPVWSPVTVGGAISIIMCNNQSAVRVSIRRAIALCLVLIFFKETMAKGTFYSFTQLANKFRRVLQMSIPMLITF